MGASKHSSLERDILALAVASGDLTVGQLAALLKVRPHTVRYALHRLEGAGDLRRWVYVDRQRLGFTAYNFYFNISRPHAAAVAAFMVGHPAVQWFGQTAGDRRYEATIWVRTPAELSTFFDELGARTGAQFADRIVAVEGDTWHWGQRFFSERFAQIKPFVFRYSEESYAIDPLDIKIINLRRTPEVWDNAKISRRLGVSSSTVSYRLKKLLDARVIFDSYLVDRRFDVIHEGHLLLEVRAHTKASERRIVSVCQDLAAVGGLIRCDGGWDYKVVMFESGMAPLLEAEDALRRELHDELYRAVFIARRSLLKSTAPLLER